MTKRQEEAIKTRQKLLDKATDYIVSGDFSDIKVEDITKACGCAKGTFYVYFKNKEAICCEICRNLFSRIVLRMEQMKDKPFLTRLEHYFISFMREVERYGINTCREWIRIVIDPKGDKNGWDNTKWQFDVDMLKNIIHQAIKDGELKKNTPVDLITHIIICELYGMMTCWCMSDGVFEPKDVAGQIFNTHIAPILKQYETDEK
ncbi:MAG: TetR/AcrR family transcriptional regulator [Alphaproteobacteria bacterium]|nr:TetR/AcrR family transcriptional regulator [Alphaproteobacteria bacterium]